MSDRIDSSTNHVSYHVDRARVGLSHLMRLIGRRQDVAHLMNAIHDLQLCAMDTQAVARSIVDAASDEERLMGPHASTWRAATRALYEIQTRGPCLQGDQEFDSRLPTKMLARIIKETKAPSVVFPEAIRTCYMTLDASLKVVAYSDNMSTMSGVSRQDAMGLEPWAISPSVRETGGYERIVNALEKGETGIAHGVPYVTSAGLFGKVDVCHSPLLNPDGQRIGVSCTLRTVGPVRRAT